MAGGCGTIWYQYNSSHSYHMTEGTWSLHFSNPIYIVTIRFYKVVVLSALMLDSVLVLAQALSEKGAFGGVKRGVLFYSPI